MAEDSSPKQENMVSNSGDSAVARLLLATSMAQQDMLTTSLADSHANQESESDDNVVPVSLTVNSLTNSGRQENNNVSTLDINHNLPTHDALQVTSSPNYSPNPYHRSPSPSTHSSSPPIVTSEVNCEDNHPMQNDGDTVTNFLSEQRNLDPLNLGPLSHNNDVSYMMPDSSPEDVPDDAVNGLPHRFYRCRFCNFSAPTYTQLQLHMPKHGGLKALKCPLCDYSTNDKSNFRRHRRLHLGNNPVSVLKCGKCPYSTILPRKFREHYSQVHNERIAPHYSVQTTPTSTYHPSQTYTNSYRMGHVDLNANQTHTVAQGSNLSATSALHSLLTGIHTQPLAYNHPNNPPIPGQCINQYGSFITPTRRQSDQESHLASNYLRSIVSSIMNSPHPTQVPPATASAISSSGFYISPNIDSSQQISPSQSSTYTRGRTFGYQPLHREVKIKVEPPDCDSTPDVSSSAGVRRHSSIDDINRQIDMRTLNNSYSDLHTRSVNLQNNEASTSVEVERTNSTGSISSRNERTSSVDNTVNTTVKSESVHVATQCSFPMIKSESSLISAGNARIERGIQCEILTGVRRRQQLVTGESNIGEQQTCMMVENRCSHCGIVFEDEVLFSIHIGCHSHVDPFVCNVCGKQCGNKYGFYSHIMRGHQY